MENPRPGYEDFTYELGTLISTYPPPFIYIQDIQAFRTTLDVIDALLRDLSLAPATTSPSKVYYARVDSISCFTPRLFYEAIIHALVGWEPSWDEGCRIWSAEGGVEERWNENMDTFLHGLRAAHQYLCRQNGIASGSRKGKGKQKAEGHDNVRLVIVVERVERLKDSHPELLVPLSRLAELARLDLTVLFVSQVGWVDVRPPFGASPDPYYIDVQTPSKENSRQSLISNFPVFSPSTSALGPYHPTLQPLYAHFITVLCDVCFPFTRDPQELQYIAAARWPGFSKPVIDLHIQRVAEHKEQRNAAADDEDADGDVDMEIDQEADEVDLEFVPPTEDIRMRLNRLFTPSLTNALESLFPRLSNAADWARANEPPADLLSLPRAQGQLTSSTISSNAINDMKVLPRISKFILLSSYLASTNPAKSDIRMFGRGLDEKKRKRRRGATGGKSRGGGPAKVSQRLLGPAAFPLDRMLAILGALLEENDAEVRLHNRAFTIPGEQTDMEISRVGVYASVMELTSMRLLHRTSHAERLDGPPQFKCGISYDGALGLAKELGVALNDLLWDPV